MDLYNDLKVFHKELKEYRGLIEKKASTEFNPLDLIFLPNADEMREKLVRKSGQLRDHVIRLTGKELWQQFGQTYSIWAEAFNEGYLPRQLTALNFCIDAVNEAVGSLESEASSWRVSVTEPQIAEQEPEIKSEQPKAFIAHEGRIEWTEKDVLEHARMLKSPFEKLEKPNGKTPKKLWRWAKANKLWSVIIVGIPVLAALIYVIDYLWKLFSE